MDHIPYPHYPALPPIEVTYCVEAEHIYDGLGFEKFRVRKQATWPSPHSVVADMESGINVTLDKAVSFLQSWLFFSLIEETQKLLIPEADHFTREDYIENRAGSNTILTTKRLPDLLLAWEAYDRGQSQQNRLQSLENIKDYLEVAVGFATGLMELADHVAELGWINQGRAATIEELTLCIYCLCEALGKPGHLYGINHSTLNTSLPKILERRFQLAGFCPKEIQCLAYQTFTVKYVTSALDRRYDIISHSECTKESCLRDNLNELSYIRVHAKECDTASCFDIAPHLISDILRQGSVPVICLPPSSSSCKVIPSCLEDFDSTTYVAISHVWSDGLGNATQNAMRVCQIRQIQRLVNNLYPERVADVPFWIDTLCIPPDKSLKKLALKQMKACYEKADKVLVLDSLLLRVPVMLEPTDTFLRLATSRWRYRLWTLQEAIFAKNLYYQFDGQAITLNHFDPYYNEKFPPISGEPISSAVGSTVLRTPVRRMNMEPLLSDISMEISGLYPTLHGLKEDWRILERISTTLEYRSTTNRKDEAVCIATLLGLDPSFLHDLSHSDSMIALFNSFQKVPIGLIFSPRARITARGCRWMPDTLLWQNGSSSFLSQGKACAFDQNGMYVTMPGAKLSLGLKDEEADRWYARVTYHGANVVLCLDPENPWAKLLENCSESFYIVSQRLINSSNTKALAVLLTLNDVALDNCIGANWVANLVIATEDICPSWLVDDAPSISVIEEFDVTQKWCIG